MASGFHLVSRLHLCLVKLEVDADSIKLAFLHLLVAVSRLTYRTKFFLFNRVSYFLKNIFKSKR